MSFIYPRTISVTRPPAQPSQVGDQGEAPGGDRSAETCVAKGLSCSIQLRGRQGRNPLGLPGDSDQAEWEILIPRRAAALGTINEDDVVTDDVGDRYQVTSNYWNSCGYALRAMKLKA